MNLRIVLAVQLSHSELVNFLGADNLTFHHLDWLSPTDRLSQPDCFALVNSQELLALLSCEPENQQAAWLRFFICRRDGNHADYFSHLLAKAYDYLNSLGVQSFYSLSTQDWMERLLISNAFQLDNHIVTLLRRTDQSPEVISPLNPIIRQMTARDLLEVQTVDEQAFAPAWQLNPTSLQKSYQISSYNTVVVFESHLIGYQMTTSTFTSAHLARLAVLPKTQRKHIGTALVTDMLRNSFEQGISEITVNTQLDNLNSIKLYQKLGFQSEGKLLPVFKRLIVN